MTRFEHSFDPGARGFRTAQGYRYAESYQAARTRPNLDTCRFPVRAEAKGHKPKGTSEPRLACLVCKGKLVYTLCTHPKCGRGLHADSRGIVRAATGACGGGAACGALNKVHVVSSVVFGPQRLQHLDRCHVVARVSTLSPPRLLMVYLGSKTAVGSPPPPLPPHPPPPCRWEGWPTPAPHDSELGPPLKID